MHRYRAPVLAYRIIAVFILFLVSSNAQAVTYTYRTIDIQAGTSGTELSGATTQGVLAGTYRGGSAADARHGFIRWVSGAIATITHPNAQQGTEITGINDSNGVVGNFYATNGNSNAFHYANGTFRAIVPPSAARGIVATGINNAGTIVGEYIDGEGVRRSYVNKGTEFIPIVHPKAVPGTTRVTGINHTGWQSGYYSDAAGTHGFLRAGSIYTTINHPGADASGTVATGVNASVAVTGYYHTSVGTRGFVYAGEVFSPVDVPGARATFPISVKDNGVVTGYYYDGVRNHGFIATPQRVAVRVRDFTSNIGINVHIDHLVPTYDTLDSIVTALQYLKISNVRDSPTDRSVETWGYIADRTGVKFNAYIDTGSPAYMQFVFDQMPAVARAGLLNSVEGPNEPDNVEPVAMGTTLPFAVQFQSRVFDLGRSLGLPVINMSFGTGWSADNNWSGNYDKVGDLSAISDFANGHTFPEPNVGEPGATVQMIVRNARIAASRKPMIHTEIGWDYRTPDADVPAALLQGIFDVMQGGAVKAYVYALFDDLGHGFGLMNSNGTPRPEGVALGNLMTLLADPGANAATFTPRTLDYNITNTSGGDRMYLLQKSNGMFLIAIWNETLFRHNVTLTLGTPAARVRVFNPVASTAAIQDIANAEAVTVDMTGAPLLIAVTPNTASPTLPPNVISTSANNTVINANAGTTRISVYGTGNTINGSAGTHTVAAFAGGNTVNTGGGTATVYLGGAGNRISFGAGSATVRDSGTNTIYTFGLPGSGAVETYGYIFSLGARLNLRTLLAGTQWQGSIGTLGNFLKVTTIDSNAVVSVNASGQTSGVTYPVAVFHDYATMTMASLLSYAEY